MKISSSPLFSCSLLCPRMLTIFPEEKLSISRHYL
jgi:hypothetical protein